MPKTDDDELEVFSAYEKGQLESVATKAELAKFKAAARATAVKDRRVNIRLSDSMRVPMKRLVAIGALAIAVGGCAGPMKPLEFPPSVALQDPLPGQALVYLIRAPHDQQGIAVYASGTLVAVLPNGTYTAVSLPAGRYRLTSVTHPSSQVFGSQEAAVPLELAVAPDQRRFFYVSQPSGTSSSMNLLFLGKGGILPIVSNSSTPIGPRIWKEATAREAQDLVTISKVVMPEKSVP